MRIKTDQLHTTTVELCTARRAHVFCHRIYLLLLFSLLSHSVSFLATDQNVACVLLSSVSTVYASSLGVCVCMNVSLSHILSYIWPNENNDSSKSII